MSSYYSKTKYVSIITQDMNSPIINTNNDLPYIYVKQFADDITTIINNDEQANKMRSEYNDLLKRFDYKEEFITDKAPLLRSEGAFL